MEFFGMAGVVFGIFGLVAFTQLQSVNKELEDIKAALKSAGIMKEQSSNDSQ